MLMFMSMSMSTGGDERDEFRTAHTHRTQDITA